MCSFKKIFGILFLSLSLISTAFASSISVYPMMADLTFNNRYHDIQVKNTGEDTAYVAISIYRINNPGMPNQSFTVLNDNPYQVGLIVTPNKMIVPANQMRIARVLYIGKPVQSDALYEVKFTPVSGDLVAVGGGKQNVAAGVELIIAYGVTIFVRPVDLEPKVDATRTGNSVTLSNTGNTSVLIGNCQQCQGDICQNVDSLSARLYPGLSKTYTLPQSLPLKCQEEVLQDQYFPFKTQ